MNRPCLTVGLPVYNDPDGLRRSVPTVLGQTWQGPLRLLVVDDGCTDDTTRVLASLAVADSRIEVVRHPVNLGRPYARNTILALAGDDYLAWIDAGDLWHPRKLELQLAALLDAERDRPATPLLCTGSLRWVFSDHGENRIKKPDVTEDQLHRALVGTLYPYLPALVGRATHFREAGGFDVRLLRRQDYDFLVRFVGGGGRVVTSPPHVPVFTYLKSDAGVHGGTVARVAVGSRPSHSRPPGGHPGGRSLTSMAAGRACRRRAADAAGGHAGGDHRADCAATTPGNSVGQVDAVPSGARHHLRRSPVLPPGPIADADRRTASASGKASGSPPTTAVTARPHAGDTYRRRTPVLARAGVCLPYARPTPLRRASSTSWSRHPPGRP
jgi:hypothetical protein